MQSINTSLVRPVLLMKLLGFVDYACTRMNGKVALSDGDAIGEKSLIRRSLIFLGNLVDAIVLCLSSAVAAGQTYLLGDGQDVSTPVVRAMALALKRPACLLPCTTNLLRLAGRVFGREAAIDRLVSSLRVESQRIRRELQWNPPCTLAQGMQVTAKWYESEVGQ